MYLERKARRFLERYVRFLSIVRLVQQLNGTEELLERFEEFVRSKPLSKKTRQQYIDEANYILQAGDDDVIEACIHRQNARTVLKYLSKLAKG